MPLIVGLIAVFFITGGIAFLFSRWIFRVQKRSGGRNALLVGVIIFIGFFLILNFAWFVALYITSKSNP